MTSPSPLASDFVDPLVGSSLGPYRVLQELGQGGMSVVYLAKSADDTLVALKVLHPFLAKKEDYRKRLSREARAVARLEHPNIVEVLDTSDAKAPHAFLVTEFVPGDTLRAFAQDTPLQTEPIAGALIAYELAGALEHAHSHGVIHRDLKPENVMVRDDGVLKLMDFGIAQVPDAATLTVTGTLLGSPAHMAPECIDGATADARSDVFSLGTVLYWLCTGSLPFEAPSPVALLKAITDGRYQAPQRRSPRISDALTAVITRALQTEPDARFQSAASFRDALGRVLRDAGVETPDASCHALLCSPDDTLAALHAQTRNAGLSQARDLLARGATARALAVLGPLLAAHPQDEEALALLDASESAPTREKWKPAVGIAAAAAVLSLAVWTAQRVDTEVSPPPTGATLTGTTRLPQPAASGQSMAEPAPRATSPRAAPEPAAATRRPSTRRPVKPRPVSRRDVRVRVTPFADVYVGQTRVAKSTKATTLRLAPGTHTLSFRHKYAATEERTITVPKSGAIPDVLVKLTRTKPARLALRSAVDADVTIAGRYVGTTEASAQRPVVVPMQPRQHKARKEVLITKKGYEPKRVFVSFIAGQTTTLRIVLQPVADELPPPASPPR